MTEIMEGVRILDFSQEIQGPWGTAILADMGAEVIKIERRGTGELSRGAVAKDPALLGVSPYFTVHNRGKKSVTLDLKQPDAIRIVHEIAATSDVVVNNWRVGVLERLGFGYTQLKAIKPDIVFVTASTFGPKGPWATKPGRDVLGQAASGIMDVTGYEGEIPLPAGSSVADHTSGMIEALAVLAALRYRDQTGHGQEVDVSLYGTAIAMQAWEITHHAITREPIRRAGRGHTLITSGTWGAFETADGYLCLGGVVPDQWPRFCQILDAEQLIDDPRFATPEMLYGNGDELRAELDQIFPTRPTQEWLDALEVGEILSGPVQNYDDIVDGEQALLNGYIQEVEHPLVGPIKIVGTPVGMSEARIEPRGPAPELGQHTEELLLELGYSWDDISRLRDDAVI